MSDFARPARAVRVPLDDNGKPLRDAQLHSLLSTYQTPSCAPRISMR